MSTLIETGELPTRSSIAKRIPVAVLGATGAVGQRFVQLLENHPWFRLAEVVASERSAGRSYGKAAEWRLETALDKANSDLIVKPLGEQLESALVFSSLDASVAGDAEDLYADRGAVVVTNSRNHRMDADVPLLIPEINASHLGAIDEQRRRRNGKGFIVTNPNCSTIGIAMALAPIERRFGIVEASAVTMQAISGAGYPGVPSFSILDNVIPYISGEEEKMETEPRKILGAWRGGRFEPAALTISAQANRVPVIDGHLICLSLRLRDREATLEEIRKEIESFRGEPQELALPSAPERPLEYADESDRPQPRLDRERGNGMTVTVGRLRRCPILDVRMISLVHNTIRGAAGAAILNAELLKVKGFLE